MDKEGERGEGVQRSPNSPFWGSSVSEELSEEEEEDDDDDDDEDDDDDDDDDEYRPMRSCLFIQMEYCNDTLRNLIDRNELLQAFYHHHLQSEAPNHNPNPTLTGTTSSS